MNITKLGIIRGKIILKPADIYCGPAKNQKRSNKLTINRDYFKTLFTSPLVGEVRSEA